MQRVGQHDRCVGDRCGVRRGFHGSLQVLGPAGEPGARLGHSEVEQQSVLVVWRWWFSERSAQEDGLRLGSAALSCFASGLDEPLDDPAIAGGFGGQQVVGDPLVRARLPSEQPGSTAMTLCALCAREFRIDTGPNDRMNECQRPAGLEDARRH